MDLYTFTYVKLVKCLKLKKNRIGVRAPPQWQGTELFLAVAKDAGFVKSTNYGGRGIGAGDVKEWLIALGLLLVH